MKSNPLFYDSTITKGSNIKAKFELKGLKPDEGQALVLSIQLSNAKNIDYHTLTFEPDTKLFVGFIWLPYGQSFKFQFLKMEGDKVVEATQSLSTQVSYNHQLSWEPLESLPKDLLIEKIAVEAKPESKEKRKTKEEVVENLIDKWGL